VTDRTASADDELSLLDACATAAAVQAGEVSVREVVGAAVQRAERLDPALGAVVLADYEQAMRTASRHDAAHRNGGGSANAPAPFAGVPMYVKDNADVAGLPTRHGSDAMAGARPARRTAELVGQMFDMGMVSLGKSTLPEFGFTASCERSDGTATHNPWNLGHSAGGSSSGSAALVAAGVVPVAHGVDGGGSIRIPAACCGLVGMKATRGRLVLSHDSEQMPVDILGEGVLTRSVRDTALFLAEAERRHRNPSLPALGHVTEALHRPLRIGVVVDSPTGVQLDVPTREALDRSMALLEGLGHRVEPLEIPDGELFAEDFTHYWSMMAFSVALAGRHIYDPSFDRSRLSAFSVGLAKRFRGAMWRTPANLVRMSRASSRYRSVFDDHDVVLSPTVAKVAPPLGHLASDLRYEVLMGRIEQWVSFTPLANATGIPSVSLPLGHDDDTGLPVGVLFNAAEGQDRLLLQLALQLEEAQPFRSLLGRGPGAGTDGSHGT
jgi:amidase